MIGDCMEIEFHSVSELKNRLTPALKIRRKELKKQGINLEVDEIWDYCVNNYFKKTTNLSLSKMVDYILNSDIDMDLIKSDII